MPSFQYKAVDKTGRPVRGGLDAVNEADLELRLRRMNLDLITCKQVDRKQSRLSGGGKVVRRDLINFCFDIEQMSRSGIPILEGLRDLRNTMENPRFREILTIMIEDMEGGKVLSQTKRLLIYPSMVLLVVMAVVLFLLIYLVPQVTGLLKTMGVAMPFQTRFL